MPHLNYHPELMGRMEMTPTGAFEAGSHASFVLTYTAGKFGIDDNGSLKVAVRSTNDNGGMQTDDPAAPGYVSVETSGQASLVCRYERWRNDRPWNRSLYVQVVRGFLRPGETITIRIGDRSGGSPGWRLQTFCEERSQFRVFVDAFATYDYVELPEYPVFEVVPGPPSEWKAVLPTLRRCGEAFRLGIKAEDRWGNPCAGLVATLGLRASLPVAGLPDRVTLDPARRALSVEDLSVDAEGVLRIELLDPAGKVLAVSNPLRVAADAPLVHYWGDLHTQTNETIGTNTARDNFVFGRDLAFLDVCSHQGNDFQITSDFWSHLNELSAEFDEPGRYVAIPGYEWSGNTGVGGDHNVWYRREGGCLLRSSHALVPDQSDLATDCHTVSDLFDVLAGEDVVVAAHCGGRYADVKYAHDGRIEHSVEIHSAWGTFEWILRDALDMGYRVGVVANSDDHKCRPGASYPGASSFGALGGLTCFLAPSLDRDAVFEAMRRRRHYATSGIRLGLDVRARLDSDAEVYERDPEVCPRARSQTVREAMMGDIVRVRDGAVTLRVDVEGSAPIERIEILDGLDVVHAEKTFGAADLGPRVRVLWQGSNYRGRSRQVSWDGTARLDGNAFASTRSVNFWNRDRRLVANGPSEVSWKSTTTGGFSGFDAVLADPQAGTLAVETALVKCAIPVRDIGLDDHVFDAGGLERRLRVYRLPAVNPCLSYSIERRVPLRAEGDTRLWVRVTQEDGHQAWSSPIYLFI